ncbi:adhesion G protein-coupled receptor B2 [Manacus vitellinus]|uniref:adhesion G protein-coupled receptor B2 n=1 Tax=Manacus vitellinus TaxID=328815 RepID=UPI00115F3447|nr:adhesion G protein-coupled receptor B2 [Manacus vitellinus]
MTAAGPLLLAVISSLLWLTRGFDPAPSACSALASGVLYGSFSLKDLFPTISSGCSWTLENPDPTKYSLYLRFNREEQVCTHFSPMVLPLDHYLANYTCDPRGEAASPPPSRQRPEEEEEEEEEEDADTSTGSSGCAVPGVDLWELTSILHPGNAVEENQKVKTQWPRSADEPGVYMAQTGDPAAEEWSQWSVCSLTCGQGSQVRTRSCVSSPYGTLCSGLLRETRACNNTATCPADSKWGPWNHWSLCSKTCDTGWQRRFRMCEGTGVQGYPCEGTGEEVKPCNEKKCPAYHEMCKDEYVMLMTWKKTAAGEIIYNKCPPDATGTASRRCLLSPHGVAYWGVPSFARCISHEYRYLHLSLREHLAKGQRVLAGEGMSQVVRSLLELMARKTYYSGDLLFSVEILRNVTDTFKRATYTPSSEDVQRFFQVVSYMVDAENRDKWEDAQQVSPGSVHLMKVVEDFIHLVGDALKAFQSSLIVTDNLVTSIQREPVSAVSSDINFPMKGRRGMKDWARSSEDKLFIPREVLSLASAEADESSHFVIGAAMDPSGTPSVPLMIGCAVSCMALLTLLVIYAAFWRFIKSERSIILLNFCVSILASNILILVGQSQMLSKGVCTMTAAFLHFFFLSSFCWVLTEAWQSYLAVIGRIRTRLVRKRFLCLGWVSAVLAMTDRRSILFQVLFAVFNSVQGFVIITVHGFLRREVQDVVKCQMGVCRSEENENSPDSCKNGQVQILTDFEKDVDLACQTVLFKEVNTCNPATITGTLSRISLDGDEDPKLNTTSEGGLGFSSLPGNIPPTSILVQVPKMTPNVVAGLGELGDPPAQQLSLDAPGPVYLCTESSLRPLEYGWIRAPEPPRESDYMMLPRRTGSLKPFPRDEGTLGPGADEGVPGGTGRPAAEGDTYPGFVAVDHVNVNLNQPYGTVKAPYGLQFKQHPTVRQILASELSERSRTMPRTVPGSAMKVGSLEVSGGAGMACGHVCGEGHVCRSTCACA